MTTPLGFGSPFQVHKISPILLGGIMRVLLSLMQGHMTRADGFRYVSFPLHFTPAWLSKAGRVGGVADSEMKSNHSRPCVCPPKSDRIRSASTSYGLASQGLKF